jgi:hypothetical protein
MPLEQPARLLDAAGDWTGGYEFKSQELLELSAVPIPANPDACARAVAGGLVRANEIEKFFQIPRLAPERKTEKQLALEEIRDLFAQMEALVRKNERAHAEREKALVAAIEELSELLESEPMRTAIAANLNKEIDSAEKLEKALKGTVQ